MHARQDTFKTKTKSKSKSKPKTPMQPDMASFRKQKHELTKLQSNRALRLAGCMCCVCVCTSISICIDRHRRWLPGPELLSVSSRRVCHGCPTIALLAIEFAASSQLPSAMRPTVGSPEPHCAQTRSCPWPDACPCLRFIDCQGASRGCLRQHGHPPTLAHFAPARG